MVIHVTKKAKRKDLDKALLKIKTGKQLDAKKFCGAVKWGEDGLAYQKRMRDEWE